MDEQQLRLECLREARIHASLVDKNGKRQDVMKLAQEFFDFASKRTLDNSKST